MIRTEEGEPFGFFLHNFSLSLCSSPSSLSAAARFIRLLLNTAEISSSTSRAWLRSFMSSTSIDRERLAHNFFFCKEFVEISTRTRISRVQGKVLASPMCCAAALFTRGRAFHITWGELYASKKQNETEREQRNSQNLKTWRILLKKSTCCALVLYFIYTHYREQLSHTFPSTSLLLVVVFEIFFFQ